MSFDSFLKKQNGIYAVLRAQAHEVPRQGLRPEVNLFVQRGGFTIALKYPASTANGLSALSNRIARLVPSTAYEPGEIHTTLASVGMEQGFAYRRTSEQRKTLDTLFEVVERVCAGMLSDVSVDLNEIVVVPGAAIALGTPSRGFVALVEALVEEARALGLSLESAWGAHVTLARFKQEVSGVEVEPLIRLVGTTEPPGKSVAQSVAVGYSLWELTPDGPQVQRERIHGQFATYREHALTQGASA